MWSQIFADPGVLGICAVLASMPIIAYMWFFLKKDPEPKKLVIRMFMLGCFSVIPLGLMQYLFSVYTDFDVYSLIRAHIPHTGLMWITMYLFIGFTEEYLKHLAVVIGVGTSRKFRRVVDGIEFSIIAALGFSFIEHIVYLISIYNRGGWDGLIVPFIFRSILTTLAHACFSGIYGYYYGKAHFMKSGLDRNKTVARGLISAMLLHGAFNTFLEYNIVWAIVPLLMVELSFILYELKLKRNKLVHQGRDEG